MAFAGMPHEAPEVLASRASAASRWRVDSVAALAAFEAGQSGTAPQLLVGRSASSLPSTVDPSSAWQSFLVRRATGTVSAQFVGFSRREDDPRRAERGACRGDDIVFVADRPIPLHAQSHYFEMTLERAERSSRDSPAVSVGLWSETALTRGRFGCEWGDGSFCFVGKDGTKSWFERLPPDSLSFVVGEPVDVKDITGEVAWRPATIIAVRDDAVLVHYNGWESKWDEWVDQASERIARSRTHTPGPPVHGFLRRARYASAFGNPGDVVGCLYEPPKHRVSFTLNGHSVRSAAVLHRPSARKARPWFL